MNYPVSSDKIFLCGPLKGFDGYNVTAFNMFAKHLRTQKFNVVNPVEISNDIKNNLWELHVQEHLRELLSCTCLVLMPGWKQSRSARLELMIATTLEYDIYLINTDFSLKAFEGNGSYAFDIES